MLKKLFMLLLRVFSLLHVLPLRQKKVETLMQLQLAQVHPLEVKLQLALKKI